MCLRPAASPAACACSLLVHRCTFEVETLHLSPTSESEVAASSHSILTVLMLLAGGALSFSCGLHLSSTPAPGGPVCLVAAGASTQDGKLQWAAEPIRFFVPGTAIAGLKVRLLSAGQQTTCIQGQYNAPPQKPQAGTTACRAWQKHFQPGYWIAVGRSYAKAACMY